MLWKECKLIALQTMFSNEGADINVDDSNQDYIDAMPGKANEALHQIAMVGRPILKQFQIGLLYLNTLSYFVYNLLKYDLDRQRVL